MWWMALIVVVGCAKVDDGSTTDVVDPTTEGSSSSSTSSDGPSCADGPACASDEVCVTVDEVCECDGPFEHCMLVERTPGCARSLPFDCTDAEDVEACHIALVCGTSPGQIENGVLTCEPPGECVGSCDSVEGCQTAGGDASASDDGASTA